ncbi:hypothetical protein FACS1894176_07710 [Bacteroidia bacterium]|nr:hypothetical protein FACS1894176_07710 [Bacteroidia bacterium]
MRAFVAVRQFMSNPLSDRVAILENEFKKLATYIEDVFVDYNDINEDTRTQLELINKSLAELQVQKRILDKPRNPVGWVHDKFPFRNCTREYMAFVARRALWRVMQQIPRYATNDGACFDSCVGNCNNYLLWLSNCLNFIL